MRKWLAYFFWNVFYAFRKNPRNLDKMLLIYQRTRPPNWTFKPFLHRNNEGRMWQVQLANNGRYTERRTITVDAEIADDGSITAIDLWDSQIYP